MTGCILDVVTIVSVTTLLLRLAAAGSITPDLVAFFLITAVVLVAIGRALKIGPARLAWRLGLPLTSLVLLMLSIAGASPNEFAVAAAAVLTLYVMLFGIYVMVAQPFGLRGKTGPATSFLDPLGALLDMFAVLAVLALVINLALASQVTPGGAAIIVVGSAVLVAGVRRTRSTVIRTALRIAIALLSMVALLRSVGGASAEELTALALQSVQLFMLLFVLYIMVRGSFPRRQG